MVRERRRHGERKNAYRIWWGNLKESVNLEDLVVDGVIRLK
jgi:hypothetical protein